MATNESMDSRACRTRIRLLLMIACLTAICTGGRAQVPASPVPAPTPNPSPAPSPTPPIPPVGPQPWVPPNPRNLNAQPEIELIIRKAPSPKRALETYRSELELYRLETENSRRSGTLVLPDYKNSIDRYRKGMESYRSISEALGKK